MYKGGVGADPAGGSLGVARTRKLRRIGRRPYREFGGGGGFAEMGRILCATDPIEA